MNEREQICQCPRCGRSHKHLGFGAPPASIAKGLPTREGHYWAKWRIADDGTYEGDQMTPSDTWEVVHVFVNVTDADNHDHVRVEVPGVMRSQSVENFVWGVGPIEQPVLPTVEVGGPLLWLIYKRTRNGFYRRGREGYTDDPALAGRFTEAEAKAEQALEPGNIYAVHV